MIDRETLLLKRSDIVRLLSLDECIEAVETAFRMHGEGKAPTPGMLGIHANDGGFHTKAGIMNHLGNYFVAKTNANFPQNGQKFGLPTIQGVIVVSDADNGRLLCVMDSIEITILRTGAATAVAAKYLSRPDSSKATILGCGNQGNISIRMLDRVRDLNMIYVYDINRSVADKLVAELQPTLDVALVAVDDPSQAVTESDIIVTCTSGKKPLFAAGGIRPGTFIAAVGADSESKQELDPSIFKSSKVIVDITDQAATIGDLHHAIEKGIVTRNDVFAELGEIVCGKKKLKASDNDVVVFDSTGMALQDVAAASIAFRKASAIGVGLKMSFAE